MLTNLLGGMTVSTVCPIATTNYIDSNSCCQRWETTLSWL